MFSLKYADILERIDEIDPRGYAKSRNYIDGDVSLLSPYISRGIISTKFVMESLFKKGYSFSECEKFIQELAWRDYWQQIWITKKDSIDHDLKHDQPDVQNHEMPSAILEAKTNITAIDKAIDQLYDTGYLHNHLRMYIAAICCNNGKSHWKVPAQWMYYHLKDGDWASNALSWQWTAGSNSIKKYIANQENINRYCHTEDQHTFLDKSYEEIAKMPLPKILGKTEIPMLASSNIISKELDIDQSVPTILYNYYNLDPLWHSSEVANRVFIVEPSIFKKYPVSVKNLEYAINMGKENILSLQVYYGEFSELQKEYQIKKFIFKEHPLNHYIGIEENRDWMFPIQGYYDSFFKFWNKAKKTLR